MIRSPLYNIDEDDLWSFVKIGLQCISALNDIIGPSNGLPHHLSDGDFVSAGVSCMFRKQSIPSLLPTTFLKDPTNQKSRGTFFDPANCMFCNFVTSASHVVEMLL